MSKLYDIAIIGAGGAGQMAALRGVLNHLNTIVFTGDSTANRKSRHTWVASVDNLPGMFDKKRPIAATTKDVFKFVKGKPDLQPLLTTVKRTVLAIKKEEEFFLLETKDGNVRARYVVLATGTMDVQPHIQGSIQPILPFANREDVYYCIRCDGHKTVGKNTAVIGHKAVAGWIAIMLKERYDLPKIWVLTNDNAFEGNEELNQLLRQYSIEVLEGEINDIIGHHTTGLEGFRVDGQEVPAEKAFVALGSIVYNDLARQLGAKLDERDHVVTNDSFETSVPGFYAAGDLVSGKKKQVYTAWDMAVDAVDHIDAKIRKLKRKQ